jgi:hypothetical protein
MVGSDMKGPWGVLISCFSSSWSFFALSVEV